MGISISRLEEAKRDRFQTFGMERNAFDGLALMNEFERAKTAADEYLERARNIMPSTYDDDYRDTIKASPYGGFKLDNPEVVAKLRKALKAVLS